MTACPECGATNCESRFHEFLALEFSNAAYGNVHHLTVAAYMLQHSSKLTREGWRYERELLRAFLVENKTPAFIRRQNRDRVDDSKRTFKIKSKDGSPFINRFAWTKTILNVRAENAEVYCADITTWAGAVLKDAEEIKLEI
ncbi:MAG TPA: DUF5946 family protein [Anaerolineales bacterium]|nr:DUF5946 family protein [Anaerolineales bacterium]